MNLATRLAITLCLLGGSAPGAPPAVARPATYHSAKGMMRAIVLNMGDEGRSVTDARYDSLFRSGDATQGVEQMIRAGRFFINGMAMPATAEDFAKTCPGGYLVNQIAWLKRDAVTGAWKGGFKAEKPAASYDAAALATATGIVAGLEVRLYDTDHDGFADRIEADYKEGVTVGRVLHRRNATFSVRRADHGVGPAAGAATGEGRAFDSAHFTATSGEAIAISNRPGEFVNAQKFFGFDKDPVDALSNAGHTLDPWRGLHAQSCLSRWQPLRPKPRQGVKSARARSRRGEPLTSRCIASEKSAVAPKPVSGLLYSPIPSGIWWPRGSLAVGKPRAEARAPGNRVARRPPAMARRAVVAAVPPVSMHSLMRLWSRQSPALRDRQQPLGWGGYR